MFKNMSWKQQIAIYTFCIFFTSASYTMCVPFLTVYLLELGATESNIQWWSAWVFSICFFIAAVMAPIWGKISDTKGKKSMALRSAVLLCLAYSSGAFCTAPIHLFFMRVLQGFANGFLPVVQSIVSSQSPKEKLGTSLSIVQSSQLIGTVSGPLIGGFLADIFGYRASFVIAGIFLGFVAIIIYFVPERHNADEVATEKTTIFQDIKFCFTRRTITELLVFFAFFNMLMLTIQPILPLFIKQLTGSYDNVAFYAGLACSLPPFVGAFIAPLWGIFGQRKGYYLTMSICFAGAGVFLGLQGLSTSYIMLLILSSFMGLFMVGAIPSLCAALTLSTPADFKGRAFGMMTMSGQVGCMIGPVIGGYITHNFDYAFQFNVTGISLLILGLYIFRRHFVLKKQKRDAHLDNIKQAKLNAQEQKAQNLEQTVEPTVKDKEL